MKNLLLTIVGVFLTGIAVLGIGASIYFLLTTNI